MSDPRVIKVAMVLNEAFAERAEHPSVWENETEEWQQGFIEEAERILAAIDDMRCAVWKSHGMEGN